MTFTVSPWLMWAGLCLILFGAWFVGSAVVYGMRDAAGWLADWLQGRIDPPWWWKPWLYRRAEKEPLEELPLPLPPERSWEQMTSHQLPVVGMSPRERKDWEHREGVRRRGAKRVEMTHRAHYAAMGLDYPSGLMARVRELTP